LTHHCHHCSAPLREKNRAFSPFRSVKVLAFFSVRHLAFSKNCALPSAMFHTLTFHQTWMISVPIKPNYKRRSCK